MASEHKTFTTARGLRLRRSLRDLEKEHFELLKRQIENPPQSTGPYFVSELERLVLAWKHISELPPDAENSFFTIGGYHGAPYRGAGWSNEDALRTAPGASSVTLPFLDWCDDETKASGLPQTLTLGKFPLGDGVNSIKNPLRSFVFPQGVFSPLNQPITGNSDDTGHGDYTKLAGYETVRFPYRGLVGNATDLAESKQWNENIPADEGLRALNENVKNWLHNSFKNSKGQIVAPNTYHKFKKCLEAPNYVLFSNTSSMSQYNQEKMNRKNVPATDPNIVVVSLESPHNDMHLSVGGFNLAGSDRNAGQYSQANGDMINFPIKLLYEVI